ncbi:Uma2 family endonuclease [Deinococcus sp. AJ005]|uniref:Uma2 family endonuclease n=1 Tax=Deinococcus sp. AJ005 TaxID=2652443 RepID=UPI0018657938
MIGLLSDSTCWSYVSDLKVRVIRDGSRRYYLPDTGVVYDSQMVGTVETQPCLIVEILSASTRSLDLAVKASDCQRIDSLQGYLIVDSEARGMIFHRRTLDGWQFETMEESVELTCVGVSLSVAEIYRNVGL